MQGLAPDGSKRSFEPDKDARFVEWNNHGPGANQNLGRQKPDHTKPNHL
jgi:pectinesterase